MVDTLDQVLSAVPDATMKARWREAEASGQLPALSSLPVPNAPVSSRSSPEASALGETLARGPVIPEEVVADVQILSRAPFPLFRGQAKVEAAEPGRLTLSVEVIDGPIEIYYKLPSGAGSSLRAAPGDLLEATLRNDLPQGSVQRRIELADREGRLVLAFLSEGGTEPVTLDLATPALSIVQSKSDDTGYAELVAVSRGDSRRLPLVPGRSVRIENSAGTVELLLLGSVGTPPGQELRAEGDLYHVSLMAYPAGN